jgi:hypothetical protein
VARDGGDVDAVVEDLARDNLGEAQEGEDQLGNELDFVGMKGRAMRTVLLPLPVRPMTATRSPASNVRLISLRMSWPSTSYRTVTLRNSTAPVLGQPAGTRSTSSGALWSLKAPDTLLGFSSGSIVMYSSTRRNCTHM